MEAELGGRVGVFATLPGTGWTLAHRADEAFAMCSTFKWVLAAGILAQVDAGTLSLEQELSFGEEDLQEWAPVTRTRVAEGRLSISTLCEAAVTQSDNTAANLLLGKLGGPPGFTQLCRGWGDGVTRLDRDEPLLNMNTAGDSRDTTSPRAMAMLLHHVITSEVLERESRDLLITWLMESKTGQGRLRAGLPESIKMGHKTGGGNRGAVNDVAVFWTAAGEPCFLASYLSGSERPINDLESAHAQIARIVYEALS